MIGLEEEKFVEWYVYKGIFWGGGVCFRFERWEGGFWGFLGSSVFVGGVDFRYWDKGEFGIYVE